MGHHGLPRDLIVFRCTCTTCLQMVCPECRRTVSFVVFLLAINQSAVLLVIIINHRLWYSASSAEIPPCLLPLSALLLCPLSLPLNQLHNGLLISGTPGMFAVALWTGTGSSFLQLYEAHLITSPAPGNRRNGAPGMATEICICGLWRRECPGKRMLPSHRHKNERQSNVCWREFLCSHPHSPTNNSVKHLEEAYALCASSSTLSIWWWRGE